MLAYLRPIDLAILLTFKLPSIPFQKWSPDERKRMLTASYFGSIATKPTVLDTLSDLSCQDWPDAFWNGSPVDDHQVPADFVILRGYILSPFQPDHRSENMCDLVGLGTEYNVSKSAGTSWSSTGWIGKHYSSIVDVSRFEKPNAPRFTNLPFIPCIGVESWLFHFYRGNTHNHRTILSNTFCLFSLW
jgi:hypothetical protein